MSDWLDQIKWNADGLVPVVVQETGSNKVLMHAWMNREALKKTADEKKAVYWSRSRQSLWIKGETSGHFQWVESIMVDCDFDTVLLVIRQEGGIACHTGRQSCFFTELDSNHAWQTTAAIIKDPKDIYK